jgi:hypothetical protein
MGQWFESFRRWLMGIPAKFTSPAYVWGAAAAGVFLSVTIPLTIYGRGERSGWIVVSQIWCTAFGFNYAIGDMPLYMEDVSFLHQVTMFLGAAVEHSLYSVRPLYSFIASLIAPVTGMISSFMILNYLVWAACAYVAWRFTLKLFGDRMAAFISVIFVAGGFGFVFHLGDYSPHLLSFLAYYLGILLVYESRVWAESRPLKTHLVLAMYFALAYLSYDIGVPLIVGYVAVAIWRNRWWRIGSNVAIALTAKPLWVAFLPMLTWLYSGHLSWVNYYGYEGGALGQAVMRLIGLLGHPREFLQLVLPMLREFSYFEFPLLICLGMLCWLGLHGGWRLFWFISVFFCLPIIGGLVFAVARMTTRGYFVFGVSLLVYAPLAGAVARNLRAMQLTRRVAAVMILAVALAGQYYWSTAHFRHELGPAVSYHLGQPDMAGENFFKSVPIISLTGAEPTPVMFGGKASLREAGLYVPRKTATAVSYNMWFALVARLPIVIYALGLAALVLPFRRWKKKVLIAVTLLLWLVPPLLCMIEPLEKPEPTPTSVQAFLPNGRPVRYTIKLSDSFVSALRQHADEPALAEFQYGMAFSNTWRLWAGDRQVPTLSKEAEARLYYDLYKLYTTVPDLLHALEHSGNELTLEIVPRPGDNPYAFGWQRRGLPGRTLVDAVTGARWHTPNIPAFEIRVYRTNSKGKTNTILLVGF